MTHAYLYFSLWLIMLLIFPSLKIGVFFVGFIYALYEYGRKCAFLCIAIGLFSLLFVSNSYENIQTNILKIESIKSNYAIASHHNKQVILYNIEDVGLEDIVFVQGSYTPIYSQKNANTYQFEKYMNQRGIYESMYVETYKILKKAKSIRSVLYRYIHSLPKNVRTNLLSLFYKIKDDSNDIIALSGMHLHCISLFLSKLWKKKKAIFDSIISFVFYICFPISSSIVCMLFFALGKLLFSNKDAKDILGLNILMVLFYNPYYVYEFSFQIIVLFTCISLFDNAQIHSKIKSFLILFPLQLYHFHEFYIVQFVIFPFLRIYQSIILCLGIFTIFIPKLNGVLNSCMQINDFINTSISNTYAIIGKPYYIWILYWIFLSLKLISVKKDSYVIKYLILIGIQIHLFALHPLGEVTFLDVGQGDAILLREPFGQKVVMIDVAGKINDTLVEKRIYPYLKMEGIRAIDLILITHNDYDHCGGLEELKQLIDVKQVQYKRENVCLNVTCLYQVNTKEYEDENDNSMVLYAHIGTLDYLFMADASKSVEKDIIDMYNTLEIDILKVGHHGSNTSSDMDFINQIHPLISVISSGKNNVYKHPSKEVLETLKQCGSYILNTQNNGSISIFYTSFINFLRTGNNEFAIIK